MHWQDWMGEDDVEPFPEARGSTEKTDGGEERASDKIEEQT